MKVQLKSLNEIDSVAEQLLAYGGDTPIWIFNGDMGAGKTTLIKSICERLGVQDVVNSPTFSIVNEYIDAEDNKIYHFDLYRIEDEEEILDIGIEEYLASGFRCFIEWPAIAANHLPMEYMTISLNVNPDTIREIELEKHGKEEGVRF